MQSKNTQQIVGSSKCMRKYSLEISNIIISRVIIMKQKSEESQAGQQKDQDLVDLQPDTQSTIYKRIVAPKVIILTFLSLIFISKNIYNIYVIGPATPASPPPPTNQPTKQDDPLMDRMYGYCILTAVLFVVYILMVRANDRALIKKLEQQKMKREQQQQIKRQETEAHVAGKVNQDKKLQQNVEVKPE